MRSSKQSHVRGHRAKSKQQDNSKEFEKYYSGVYGSRWPVLREALLKPTVHAAVTNGFIRPAADAACADAGLQPLPSLGPLHSYRRAKSSGSYPPPPLDPASALRVWYWLDLASVLPVLLLQPRRGHSALDMCAAPGGKSMLLAQRLFGPYSLAPPPAAAAAAAPAPALPHQPASPPAGEAGQAADSAGPEPAGRAAADAEAASATQSSAAAQQVPAAGSGGEKEGEEEEARARARMQASEASDRAAAEDDRATRGDGGTDDQAAGQPPQEAASAGASAQTAAVQPPAPSFSPLPLPLPLPLPPGKLVCNEPDRPRLQRLQRVLEEYLPLSARANVEVLNYQGHAYWGRNQASSYDRVLVDAPCSSDRHVLQQAAQQQRGAIAEADWSLAGCRRIADEQLQLCLAAMRALRVGGRLVYSTCSIAPLQNDQVVERLLSRCGPGAVRVLPAIELLKQELEGAAAAGAATEPAVGTGPGVKNSSAKAGGGGASGGAADVVGLLGVEATKHGAICLPDRGGWGPIFVAVLEKVGQVEAMGAAALLRPQPTGGSDDEDEDGEEEEGEEAEVQAGQAERGEEA
ncbi:5-methylcytosine rRNA methyltransferase nsun4 [Pleodorina starrii]|uniref:NOL1/NOP2/Sun domain family member 4 n=1 Tax=Pleodorina starrii TaxID=330485 RepID=A0A9W6BMQ6_9CHLO|nr:5-methylcytosine rRNA methyltransferase nsun4 [Pleodorina starrii]GLC54427.1 5-methylcytosine rRNA methyltransferase nsun4 [Pleodorina starrii]GLC72080.1 5-methylcytosine rRNA methyltransferase nsun4 [Pleodorina starrii]